MDMQLGLTIIQGLTSVILLGFGWWLAQLSSRVRMLEDKMATYGGDVRVANEKLSAIDDKLAGHIQREEHETWGRIDTIAGEVAQLRVDMASMVTELKSLSGAVTTALQHVVDHDKEATGWKHRIVALEAQVGKIESSQGA